MTMKVSMDGLRRSLGESYNDAVRAFESGSESGMRNALWDLRRMIGGLMCIYTDDPDDMMSNMGDDAEKLLEPSGEEGE